MEGQELIIERDDVEIVSEDIPGWTVATDGSLTVALDLEITEALKREGMAREIVKRIQAYRKAAGFEITDHIKVRLEPNTLLQEAAGDYADYICGQVLADEFTFGPTTSGQSLDFEDFQVGADILKA